MHNLILNRPPPFFCPYHFLKGLPCLGLSSPVPVFIGLGHSFLLSAGSVPSFPLLDVAPLCKHSTAPKDCLGQGLSGISLLEAQGRNHLCIFKSWLSSHGRALGEQTGAHCDL